MINRKSLRAERICKTNKQEDIAVFPASMTVEAALVLPLFLFCVFNLRSMPQEQTLRAEKAAGSMCRRRPGISCLWPMFPAECGNTLAAHI